MTLFFNIGLDRVNMSILQALINLKCLSLTQNFIQSVCLTPSQSLFFYPFMSARISVNPSFSDSKSLSLFVFIFIRV